MKYLIFPHRDIMLVDEVTGDFNTLRDLIESGAIHAKAAKMLLKNLTRDADLYFDEVSIKNYEHPEELLDENGLYTVYKLKPLIDSIRGLNIIDILRFFAFRLTISWGAHFFLKGVPRFPIVGCSVLIDDSWFSYRKKSGTLEKIPRKMLIKCLKEDGYITILPYISIPCPTFEVMHLSENGTQELRCYRVFC